MKKTFILLAASAMLLAACNKEESTSENGYSIQGDKITFGVGMDNIQGEGKHYFDAAYNGIWFENEDSMLVNGTACAIRPIASTGYPSSSDTCSPIASVTAGLSASGAYDFVYPANRFSIGNNGQYETTFPTNIADDYNGYVDEGSYKPLWPMYAGIADLATFHGTLRMRNACAFLLPHFNYDSEWANVVLSPYTGLRYTTLDPEWANAHLSQYTGVQYSSCPNITCRGIRIFSNQKLRGPAHLDCSNPNYPIMVMDETIADDEREFIECGCNSDQPLSISCNTANGNGATNIGGIFPIAPRENNDAKTFRVKTFISTSEPRLYMVFSSNESATTSQIKRNNQYLLDVNFATATNYTYMPSGNTHTAEAYATTIRNGGTAEIQFANGTLYVSTDPIDLEQIIYLGDNY